MARRGHSPSDIGARDPQAPSWLGDVSRAEGPLHAQIGEVIEQAIESGDLQPGDRLPPERELAQWFGVNRLTLRQALSDLERGRLIRRYNKVDGAGRDAKIVDDDDGPGAGGSRGAAGQQVAIRAGRAITVRSTGLALIADALLPRGTVRFAAAVARDRVALARIAALTRQAIL